MDELKADAFHQLKNHKYDTAAKLLFTFATKL
jgi:hypothetical protein